MIHLQIEKNEDILDVIFFVKDIKGLSHHKGYTVIKFYDGVDLRFLDTDKSKFDNLKKRIKPCSE